MRDRLPDLLHERLSAGVLAEVRAHVDTCADCREELALLARIRAAGVAPSMDAARIAAALPRYRAAPMWRRAVRSPQLRAAAAVVLLLGGYSFLQESAPRDPLRSSEPVVESPAHELGVGDTFQDLSDGDLVALLDELGKLEAVTPDAAEDEIVPVVGRGGA